MFKFEIIKGVSYHNNIKKNIQINFPSNKYFWPYQNSFTRVKENLFQEKSSYQSLNNQWIQLSSSIEIDNIIQEEEVIFKKNPIVGLPEVSILIDPAISKRQRDQRKHSFLEKKKILHKRETGFTINTQKYDITWWIVLWSNRLINFTKYFF